VNKGEIFAVTVIVLLIALGMLIYKLWHVFLAAAWRRARRNAVWLWHKEVQSDGSVKVIVRREARLGRSVQVVGSPVEVAVVAQRDVESGLLQEALARADILADAYNNASSPVYDMPDPHP
jgi:hypothetical protein